MGLALDLDLNAAPPYPILGQKIIELIIPNFFLLSVVLNGLVHNFKIFSIFYQGILRFWAM